MFTLLAPLWLGPYTRAAYALARPPIGAVPFQTVERIEVEDGGAKVHVTKAIRGSAERFPRVEEHARAQNVSDFHPKRVYTLRQNLTYEYPARLVNASLIVALVLALPRRPARARLKALAVLVPLLLAVQSAVLFLTDLAYSYQFLYPPGHSALLDYLVSLKDLSELATIFAILAAWFAFGCLFRYE